MRKQKKSKDVPSSEATVSHLKKVLDDLTVEDSIGILNAIEETVEELESRVQLLDNVAGEEVEDAFQPATKGPVQFTAEQPSGHLVTTEQVNNALRRDGSETPPRGSQASGSDIMKQGLRFRLKRRKEEKKKRKEEEAQAVGIFGTTSKPSKWSLSHYLQSVASTREKRMVAVSAWMLALIGLIISLVFVTKDFIQGREEMASTIRYKDASRLSLPSIWLCKTDTVLPPFTDQPTQEYQGYPFVWMDFFRGSSSRYNLTYPETEKLPQLDVIAVNVVGRRCQAHRAMDPEIFRRENNVRPDCYYCLAITRNPAIVLEKTDDVHVRNNGNDDVGALDAVHLHLDHVALRMSLNSVLSTCRRSQFGLPRSVFSFLKSELKRNHANLSSRGIIDFDGLNPDNGFYDHYLWPFYRWGFQNTTADFVVFDIVDMFCNVYLFSGYFYPSTSTDIKFKFNSVHYHWERAGDGPYYPKVFSDFYNVISEKTFLVTDSPIIGEEKYENVSMYVGRSVQLITNHSRMGRADAIATLEPSRMVSVHLSRNLIHRREFYSSQVFRAKLQKGDTRAINYVYYLDLSFRSFVTRMVSDQLTVSWSAFIADFFGLTSMFLDVSVYTLIVSPLIMRARKKALLARKMRRTDPQTV